MQSIPVSSTTNTDDFSLLLQLCEAHVSNRGYETELMDAQTEDAVDLSKHKLAILKQKLEIAQLDRAAFNFVGQL